MPNSHARSDPRRGSNPAKPSMARTNVSEVRSSTVCGDRKSTRLNSSHVAISYAAFCLKKKNTPLRRGNRSCQIAGHLCVCGLLRRFVLRHLDDVCSFFFNDTATTEIYTLSLHDALPISSTVC